MEARSSKPTTAPSSSAARTAVAAADRPGRWPSFVQRHVLKKTRLEQALRDLFALADVRVGGDRPWDVQVHHPAFYERVLAGGSMGLGESYMDGWWDCPALDVFFSKVLGARLDARVKASPRTLWYLLLARIMNRQRRARAYDVGVHHYDLGNDLFEAMLDRRMVYSCGYWKEAANLDEAQEAKLELVCRKLGLQPGQRVLDIGCGWGSLAHYAAAEYGAAVVGITVSREQAAFARAQCRGLPVEIRLQDYRDVTGTYDHVVSIGMFEHVGYKNYRTYMEVVHRCLEEGGLFLLHTIGRNTSATTIDPWFDRYIFPNSMLPSAKQITAAAEGLFVLEDWHSFGTDYDRTLMAWHRNFTARWPQLQGRYDERFYRMWTYYLLCCAGAFRSRTNQLWQMVYAKGGVPGGYTGVR